MVRAATVWALLIGVAGICRGGELAVCLVDEVGVDTDTVKIFRESLEKRGKAIGVAVRFGKCGERSVRLSLQLRPGAGQPEDALGAARVVKGWVVPEVAVYQEPLRRLLYSRLPVYEGRAMAYIAAHELMHYLEQRQGHTECGLMAERVSGAQLMAGLRD